MTPKLVGVLQGLGGLHHEPGGGAKELRVRCDLCVEIEPAASEIVSWPDLDLRGGRGVVVTGGDWPRMDEACSPGLPAWRVNRESVPRRICPR